MKTRLSPAVSPDRARSLYVAFLSDLAERLRASKFRPTVFVDGEPTPELHALLDPAWPLVAQASGDLGARLQAAFAHLLDHPRARAVVIGSDSPDLPLAFVKRAFHTLKHRDVVLGPAVDGGYYLIGLRAPAPSLFDGIGWGTPSVLDQTLDAVERTRLSLSVLPPWYDVDDDASLRFFAALNRARRAAKQSPLRHSGRALADLARE